MKIFRGEKKIFCQFFDSPKFKEGRLGGVFLVFPSRRRRLRPSLRVKISI